MQESRSNKLGYWEQDYRLKREATALKQKILDTFWRERILVLKKGEPYQGRIKGFLKSNPPKSLNRAEWSLVVDSQFDQCISDKNKNNFLMLFAHVPPINIMQIDIGEGFGIVKKSAYTDTNREFANTDLADIMQYMAAADMSAVASVSSLNNPTTIATADNNNDSIFSIHSVAKIMTGVLVCTLLERNIIKESDLTSTIQIDPKLLASIGKSHPNIAKRLTEVTLLQAMTHNAGFVDYMPDYVNAIKQSSDAKPTINSISDFLAFAEDTVTNPNGGEYSNLGSLFVGIALEHAYQQHRLHHPELKLPALDFYGMVDIFIKDEARMQHLLSIAPSNARVNNSTTIDEPTPEAIHLIASPAGGFWTTAEDLRKFGEWLYQKCKVDGKDSDFMEIIRIFGKEFYNIVTNTIEHPGENPSASAMLSISLNTGTVIATVANSSRSDAHQLHDAIKRNLFVAELVEYYEEKPTKSPSSSPTLFQRKQPSVMNSELKKLYDSDEAERQPGQEPDPQHDKERRKAAIEIIANIPHPTKEDYYHAAIIFQHGHTEHHYQKAHEFATKSHKLGAYQPDTPHAEDNRFLVASTYDRWQLNQDPPQPQKYGTQYAGRDDEKLGWKKDELIPPNNMHQYDRTAIDKDRASIGIVSIDEQERDWGITRDSVRLK